MIVKKSVKPLTGFIPVLQKLKNAADNAIGKRMRYAAEQVRFEEMANEIAEAEVSDEDGEV
jgi:hypothetical protein